MVPDKLERLKAIHDQLIRIAQAWALRRKFDPDRARALRREAILINHAHYLETVPAYRRLAWEEGIGELDDIEPIQRDLMSTDDLFKSYSQTWLDEADYASMNEWLSQLYHRKIGVDVAGVQSVDGWIARLDQGGVRLVYSSGTSGAFSFIPRDTKTWALVKTVNTCYLVPLLMYDKLGTFWQRLAVRWGSKLFSPGLFEKMMRKMAPQNFDAVFLDFRRGRTGMQAIGQELAPVFRRYHFLYETPLTASVLRSLARGAKTEEDQRALEMLLAETVEKREQNHARLVGNIKRSTAEGQKVFMFGAPYQFKELCAYMDGKGEQIVLNSGSLVLFGGGWKSFGGERISRDALVAMISESFGLVPEMILEGYSMTEINVFMVRCDHGRFHIPPIIEPVILDEELSPVEGKDVRGTFGFLDPLAISYPGFIISGDDVRLVDGGCPCGLHGPGLTEIGRARHREIKGCGGMMASIRA